MALTNSFSYRFAFDELALSAARVGEMIGYTEGTVPEPFNTYINDALAICRQNTGIQGQLFVFDEIIIRRKEGLIVINGSEFCAGKIISSSLSKSEGIALFVCTAGAMLEEYAKQQNKLGELPAAYVADLCGSLVVEAAIDLIQLDFVRHMNEKGMGISNRYSPGYCGWSVAEQHQLFALMPGDVCGIKLTDSSLMQPIKSVSGIIGFGRQVKQKGYTCKVCTMENCVYRNSRRQ